jgi:hypothetical protein
MSVEQLHELLVLIRLLNYADVKEGNFLFDSMEAGAKLVFIDTQDRAEFESSKSLKRSLVDIGSMTRHFVSEKNIKKIKDLTDSSNPMDVKVGHEAVKILLCLDWALDYMQKYVKNDAVKQYILNGHKLAALKELETLIASRKRSFFSWLFPTTRG